MSLSFSRQFRLLRKQEFQFVFDHANKVSSQTLLAFFCPNKLPHPRLGIIISKQKVRQAALRNLIRRHVRETFRHDKEMLKGLDIIVLIRSECTPQHRSDWRGMAQRLWHAILKKHTPKA